MILARRAMPLKKTTLVPAVSALAALIVLPVVHSVNHLVGKHTVTPSMRVETLVADGWPLPPPIQQSQAGTLVADGWPLPPPIRQSQAGTLVADGWPLPPPIRQSQAGILVLA